MCVAGAGSATSGRRITSLSAFSRLSTRDGLSKPPPRRNSRQTRKSCGARRSTEGPAESAGAHPAIARAYADFVTQMDRQTTFLVNLGVSGRLRRIMRERSLLPRWFKGGYSGAEAFAVLDQEEDISTKEAAIAAIVIGAVTYAADAWVKAGQRNAA